MHTWYRGSPHIVNLHKTGQNISGDVFRCRIPKNGYSHCKPHIRLMSVAGSRSLIVTQQVGVQAEHSALSSWAAEESFQETGSHWFLWNLDIGKGNDAEGNQMPILCPWLRAWRLLLPWQSLPEACQRKDGGTSGWAILEEDERRSQQKWESMLIFFHSSRSPAYSQKRPYL